MNKGNKRSYDLVIFNYKRAFTLTEVLIATAIVGVIAALVLPMVITTYQNKAFEYMQTKQTESITSTLEALPVLENKTRFSETMMSSDDISDDTSGLFLKKYFKVARYCGNIDDGGANCFASEYFSYNETTHQRESHKAKDLISRGTCAQLKNGTSICITPQPKTKDGDWTAVQVVMDLNGLKGPNVVGRDFVPLFSLPLISAGSVDLTRTQGREGVFAENETPITPTEVEECTSYTTDKSNGCCKYKKRKNMINAGDVCCQNPQIGPTVAACNTAITLTINYWPTESYYSKGVKPWMSTGSSISNGTTSTGLSIPDTLGVKIRCKNGSEQGGVIYGAAITSAIQSNKKLDWPNGITSEDCRHPNETLLWSNNSMTQITINGITYKLKQY